MNWINAFEIICYIIVAIFLVDVIKKKSWKEFYLFVSAAIAGFALELLAVALTDIYHYSNLYYIMVGSQPYQFPFFGGLMWGAVAVLSLRLARKLALGDFKTALLSGFFVVSMDLLLDVAAIRLSGGFWVWDGVDINLAINQHTFMSVIWVNFLGYMFETPSLIYYSKKYWKSAQASIAKNIFAAIIIGVLSVLTVGALSFVSLKLNALTDDYFAFVAFVLLWIYIFSFFIKELIKKRGNISFKLTDPALFIFWLAIYLYCLVALVSLNIFKARPLYGVLAGFLFVLTIGLSFAEFEEE